MILEILSMPDFPCFDDAIIDGVGPVYRQVQNESGRMPLPEHLLSDRAMSWRRNSCDGRNLYL
jgi:hypothetical protein